MHLAVDCQKQRDPVFFHFSTMPREITEKPHDEVKKHSNSHVGSVLPRK